MTEGSFPIRDVVCWMDEKKTSRPSDVTTISHVMQYAQDHPGWVVECTLKDGDHWFVQLNENGSTVISLENPFQRD